MRSITMTAKHAGTCTQCNRPIRRGMTIIWSRGHGAIHVKCVPVRAPRIDPMGGVDVDLLYEDQCARSCGL